MPDKNNSGQFGNRSDTKQKAKEGGRASARSSKGAAGSTQAAKLGGEHSHGGGRPRNNE